MQGARPQIEFNNLKDLFYQVGLHINMGKKLSIACQPCHAIRGSRCRSLQNTDDRRGVYAPVATSTTSMITQVLYVISFGVAYDSPIGSTLGGKGGPENPPPV